MKNIVVLTLFVLSVFSCEKEIKKTNSTPSTVVEESKELIVKLSLKTNVEDTFIVRMDNIEVDEFQKKNISIREFMPITTSFETINANFGPDNMSNNLNIGLGLNAKTIQFNTIEIKYLDTVLIINGDSFDSYFTIDEYTSLNKEEFSLTTRSTGTKLMPKIKVKNSAVLFLLNNNNIVEN